MTQKLPPHCSDQQEQQVPGTEQCWAPVLGTGSCWGCRAAGHVPQQLPPAPAPQILPWPCPPVLGGDRPLLLGGTPGAPWPCAAPGLPLLLSGSAPGQQLRAAPVLRQHRGRAALVPGVMAGGQLKPLPQQPVKHNSSEGKDLGVQEI